MQVEDNYPTTVTEGNPSTEDSMCIVYHIKIRILPKASTNQFSLFQLILDNKKRENSSAIDNIFITQTPPETVFSAATDLIFSLETFKKLKTVLYWNSLWPIDLLESFQSDSGNGLVINTTDLSRGAKSFQQKNEKIGKNLQVWKRKKKFSFIL